MSKPACLPRRCADTPPQPQTTLYFLRAKSTLSEEMMKSAAFLRFASMLASAITLFASFAIPARAETFEFAVLVLGSRLLRPTMSARGVGNREANRGPCEVQAALLWCAGRGEGNRQRRRHRRGWRGTTSASFVAGLARPVAYFEALFWIPAIPRSRSISSTSCRNRPASFGAARIEADVQLPSAASCRTAPTATSGDLRLEG